MTLIETLTEKLANKMYPISMNIGGSERRKALSACEPLAKFMLEEMASILSDQSETYLKTKGII